MNLNVIKVTPSQQKCVVKIPISLQNCSINKLGVQLKHSKNLKLKKEHRLLKN